MIIVHLACFYKRMNGLEFIRFRINFSERNVGVLLWAPSILAGTPNTLSEMAKLPLCHLIYKGTVTRPYESLPFSCVAFASSSLSSSSAFSFFFLFLCFFSRTLLLLPSCTAFTSSSSLLLGVGCNFFLLGFSKLQTF